MRNTYLFLLAAATASANIDQVFAREMRHSSRTKEHHLAKFSGEPSSSLSPNKPQIIASNFDGSNQPISNLNTEFFNAPLDNSSKFTTQPLSQNAIAAQVSTGMEVKPITIDYLAFVISPTFNDINQNKGGHILRHRIFMGSDFKNLSVLGSNTKMHYRIVWNINNTYTTGTGQMNNQLVSPWLQFDWSRFAVGPGTLNFRFIQFTQFWGSARDQGKRGQSQLRTTYALNKIGRLNLAFFAWLTQDWNSGDFYADKGTLKPQPLHELAIGPDIVFNVTDKLTADLWVAFHSTQMTAGTTPDDVWTWLGGTYNTDNYGSFSAYLNGDSYAGDPLDKQFGWLLLWSKNIL